MTPDPSDEEVRALAAEILDREAYARFRIDEEVWRELLSAVLRWLDWLESLRLTAPILYWAILAGLLLVALLLLAHVAWTVRIALRMPGPEPQRRRVQGPGFLDRAEALAAEGRFVDAARQLELATLELLLRGRVIELSRYEPNRVLRRRLAAAELPEAERDELLRLLDRLEWRLFRSPAEDRPLYDGWLALHRRLLALRPAAPHLGATLGEVGA